MENEQEQAEQQIQTEGELAPEAIPAEGEQSQPAEGDSVQKPVEYDIDGEKVTPDQIKAWKAGHMMQSDYTRKMQELAKLREEYAPYQQLGTYLQQNPDKAAQIAGLLQGEADPRDLKISQLEHGVKSLIEMEAKREGEQLLSQVRADAKYGGLFNNKGFEEMLLATHLQKGRGSNLRETADEIHKEWAKVVAETKLSTEKNITKNLSSPTRKPSAQAGTMSPPKGFDPSKISWQDADKLARSMLS